MHSNKYTVNTDIITKHMADLKKTKTKLKCCNFDRNENGLTGESKRKKTSEGRFSFVHLPRDLVEEPLHPSVSPCLCLVNYNCDGVKAVSMCARAPMQ